MFQIAKKKKKKTRKFVQDNWRKQNNETKYGHAPVNIYPAVES